MTNPIASRLELFHLLTQPDSAAVRREVVRLKLEDRVEFRNVGFDSHRLALEEHGGEETPAIWDGTHLRVGRAACEDILRSAASSA